jgi:hypothetical protein
MSYGNAVVERQKRQEEFDRKERKGHQKQIDPLLNPPPRGGERKIMNHFVVHFCFAFYVFFAVKFLLFPKKVTYETAND